MADDCEWCRQPPCEHLVPVLARIKVEQEEKLETAVTLMETWRDRAKKFERERDDNARLRDGWEERALRAQRDSFAAQAERDDALAKLALFWCAAQKELGDAFSWSASVRYSDVAHMVEGLRVATLLAGWEEKRFIIGLQPDHLSGDLLDALARFRKLGTTDD